MTFSSTDPTRHRAKSIFALVVAITMVFGTAAMAHHDDPTEDDPLEIVLQGDAIAGLPVFKGPFPQTKNMEFLSQIAPEDLGAIPLPAISDVGRMNDIWGWTSPAGGEYALLPHSGGIAIVRVTDPENPEFLGKVESPRPGAIFDLWGDAGAFGNFAYFTSEVGSDLVIVDLSGADALGPASDPNSPLPLPVFFVQPGGYDGAHNVQVNEETGFAYLAGVNLADGAANNACGLEDPPRFNTLILDLNTDPTNPDVAACVPNIGEHDFYPVVYNGPDEEHQGKEILFVFDGRDREGQAAGNPVGGLTEIWDVTDKNNIQVLSSFRVPELVFSHNGWTTEEQDFLFIGDEIDELVQAGWSASGIFTQPVEEPTNKPQTGTFVIDIRDLDNPVFVEKFTDGTVGLDHNFVVEDDKLYIASYTSGTRVLQIGRDSNGDVELSPFAVMDTEPRLQKNILNINQEEKFGTAFMGQWGIYTFPDSDTIIASDINNGLIVSRLSD